jgi:hypothetical protein
MSQSVEVERYPIVVLNSQEIALSAFGADLGVVLHFLQPLLSERAKYGSDESKI